VSEMDGPLSNHCDAEDPARKDDDEQKRIHR
jgi:hypothetical protein